MYPDDWLAGYALGLEFDAPVDNDATILLAYSMCCRVCGLAYDSCSTSQTLINSYVALGHQYSPTSTSLPRQYAVVGQPITWSVPWAHPLNWQPTFRFATLAESGMATSPMPYGQWGTMTLNGATGVTAWTPTQVCLIAIQFVIQTLDRDTVT